LRPRGDPGILWKEILKGFTVGWGTDKEAQRKTRRGKNNLNAIESTDLVNWSHEPIRGGKKKGLVPG